MNPKKVSVIGLGGTISMQEDAGAGAMPSLDVSDILALLPEYASSLDINVVNVCQKPSGSLDLADMLLLAEEIDRQVVAGVEGIVVIQGTDTLEETAFAIDLMTACEVPVVFTGAMRHASMLSADGAGNLANALIIAQSPLARSRGVLVTFDDEIHKASLVIKQSTFRTGAFASNMMASAGFMIESTPTFTASARANREARILRPETPGPVAIINAALGEDPVLLAALPDLAYRGVVIEGCGGGHVAANWMPVVRTIAAQMPVVLATRVVSGPVLRRTYGYEGSEIDLVSSGVMPAGLLSAHKARVLLSLALGEGLAASEISALLAHYDVGI